MTRHIYVYVTVRWVYFSATATIFRDSVTIIFAFDALYKSTFYLALHYICNDNNK